ncbi:MAG: UDP-N-acetylglucosamine--N-acetylmuramyl-(pentapeptide) pyrophosphoryl-undecaprenol N-acetylglucosamine transferase [Elusimicrobiota bacterium]|jgi:UDP-N-acetylglucosamine--N-acetylmuramyl-(pentapeptide) pyrophosphoryl-undecaprenol N-acetylglucosamine transferase|nr:UDP-N-acetylglucosamine--N-acetylmuramyl-(pentapeptide) pyrophosphoryl-undecaprenol N-acetylglucosamine transferase [Elusimicrobiota bacterium]
MENVFIIAADGTGGHFYPGFALGKKLIERGHDVIFVVKKGTPAAKFLDGLEMHYQVADVVGMPRGGNILQWLDFSFKMLAAILQMRRLIKDAKPVVCMGMGGYISFPLIYAARKLGVKTAVHESNAIIGRANRLSAKYADVFMLGLNAQNAPQNAVLTGTPVREEFRLKESIEEQYYWNMATDFAINILIFGGSLGARKLNFAAAKMAQELLSKTNRIHFLHVAGQRDYKEIKAIYKDVPNVEVIEYAQEIYSLMKAAQLVIARAGASSLAEIMSLKKPSILVPYPYAADNHQYYNAKIFADKGCALLLEESDNLAQDLSALIKKILATPTAIKTMENNFTASGLPDPLKAAERAARILEELAGK